MSAKDSTHGGKGHRDRGRPPKDSTLVQKATEWIVGDERQGKPRPTTAQLAHKLLNYASLHGVEESTACRAARLALILSTRPSDITPEDRKFLAARRRGDLKFLKSLEADRSKNALALKSAKRELATLASVISVIQKGKGRQLTRDEQVQVAACLALIPRRKTPHP